jgi:hypothetical protein
MSAGERPLIIACGALVSELREVLIRNGLTDAVEVRYLPANLHNRPEGIVPALREHLDARGGRPTFVGYADCGTGGQIDTMLLDYPGVERISGAHCYEFFAGSSVFHEVQDAEPGTFYLTDFLAKHFRALVWEGLGLDTHPQLRDMYFGNYTKVMYFSQVSDDSLIAIAKEAAEMLGLNFEHRHVGVQGLEASIPVVFQSAAKRNVSVN